jgi:hypothetical protein
VLYRCTAPVRRSKSFRLIASCCCLVSLGRGLYCAVVAGVRASRRIGQSRRSLSIRPGLRQCGASLVVYRLSGVLKLRAFRSGSVNYCLLSVQVRERQSERTQSLITAKIPLSRLVVPSPGLSVRGIGCDCASRGYSVGELLLLVLAAMLRARFERTLPVLRFALVSCCCRLDLVLGAFWQLCSGVRSTFRRLFDVIVCRGVPSSVARAACIGRRRFRDCLP